jgi:23S rRNA pseudouridine955/2504/2580 synthase
MTGETVLSVCQNDAGRRLDRILRNYFVEFPLSFINRLLRKKKVLVNGIARSGNYRVAQGDTITVKAAGENTGPTPPRPAPSEAEKTRLRIIYEDDDLLVVDKPRGMLTHGENSLASEVLAYLDGKIPTSLSFHPGPLHRLDRNTSGLVVFGKSLAGSQFFTHALQNGLVRKYYLALADGFIEKEETWEDYLERDKTEKKTYAATHHTAQKALTKIRPIKAKNGMTCIEAEIATGRTHQIRAQCGIHGHPLSGDKKYGGSSQNKGYFLRAYKMVIEKDGLLKTWQTAASPFGDTGE